MGELNSAREQAAFAGIEAAWQMALTAAITIKVRDDAGAVRQQAAAAALQGLADGLRTPTSTLDVATLPRDNVVVERSCSEPDHYRLTDRGAAG
jgi:PPE-repeat protein